VGPGAHDVVAGLARQPVAVGSAVKAIVAGIAVKMIGARGTLQAVCVAASVQAVGARAAAHQSPKTMPSRRSSPLVASPACKRQSRSSALAPIEGRKEAPLHVAVQSANLARADPVARCLGEKRHQSLALLTPVDRGRSPT
jgi:hypothetical protein